LCVRDYAEGGEGAEEVFGAAEGGWSRALTAACDVTALLLAIAVPLAAQSADTTRSVGMSVVVGFESVREAGGEPIGLIGASLVFALPGRMYLGPALYGAATGSRGGIFNGGLELQHRMPVSGRWRLDAGVYAGAGGGDGAPVGEGLMVRTALTVSRDFAALRVGASVSNVDFPTGGIGSTQLGAVVSWNGSYHYAPASATFAASTAPSPGGLDIAEFGPTIGVYDLDGDRRIGLIGARATWYRGTRDSRGIQWGAETATAATGDAGGYMEVLASAALERAPIRALSSLRLGVRLAAGLAGGGAIETGGGGIGKAFASLSWAPPTGVRVGVEVGRVQGVHKDFRAPTIQSWFAFTPDTRRATPGAAALTRHEWSVGLQRLLRGYRSDGTRDAVDQMGVKFNREFTRHTYFSVQAHSAFAGNGGGYSEGLIGAGVTSSWAPATRRRFRAGAELLAGSGDTELRAGIGSMRSRHGAQRTTVVELSVGRRFALSGL
jgi:hypothetical protein